MPVIFPADLLESAYLTEQELRVELAVTLFQQERLTLGQCARYAGISQVAMRRIP